MNRQPNQPELLFNKRDLSLFIFKVCRDHPLFMPGAGWQECELGTKIGIVVTNK
jgi:hypothetical protein